ncbi:MAG: VWA domain-containing protein [Sedimentisphaerales bacterium]|nr:VWA domain-containing protein [Sedimentisphaerales bacterium]
MSELTYAAKRHRIAKAADATLSGQVVGGVGASEAVESLVVLLDVSPSMLARDLPPSRLKAACAANAELIAAKAAKHPRDLVAVIAFGGETLLLHEPAVVGRHVQSLLGCLKSPQCLDWTNFHAALTRAGSLLWGDDGLAAIRGHLLRFLTGLAHRNRPAASRARGALGPDGCVKRIVLLSDGERTQGPSPGPVAERLKAQGVIIDCIGIADRASVDEVALKAIASRNPDGSPRYCFVRDRQKLIRKYRTLAGHIRPVKE